MRALGPTLVLVIAGTAAQAASFDDPDWPCIQRKVPSLTTAQMWAGPAISGDINAVAKYPQVNELASQLALRRIKLDAAEGLVRDFAVGLSEDRNQKLTAVFARSFELINHERNAVMTGISRYARKQAELSDAIEAKREELRALKAVETPDLDRIEELQDTLDWDARIFKERRQSLTYVCETPVILEQRIFALARALQAELTEE